MSEIPTRKRRENLSPEERKTAVWPLADTSNLTAERRDQYERRYQAVTGYMRGERLKDLAKQWKISRWEILLLCKRCRKVHPDGRLWGYRGLLPCVRLSPPLR